MTAPPAQAPAAQSGWNWCSKCQGMFYGPYQPSSTCPAGGRHDGAGSGNYVLVLLAAGAAQAGTAPATQLGWAWCRLCDGLFWLSGGGVCPANAGGHHDGSASGAYLVILQPDS